jgi:uncharacterized protein (TIGR03643 family)
VVFTVANYYTERSSRHPGPHSPVVSDGINKLSENGLRSVHSGDSPTSIQRQKFVTDEKNQKDPALALTVCEIDRVIQMAWEDRTAFDSIKSQFGLSPGQVIKLMRSELKPSSFRLWRARTSGRKSKHVALRSPDIDRFRCPDQKNS